MAPKDKIFKKYIEIELQLGNIERCRKLYEKYLEWSPGNCYAGASLLSWRDPWPRLKEPELFLSLQFTSLRWTCQSFCGSYAKFEASAKGQGLQESKLSENDCEQKKKCLQCARSVFERALSYSRNSAPELKEERAILLEEWLNMESSFGDLGDVDLVRVKLPKKLKKRRHIETEDGPAGGGATSMARHGGRHTWPPANTPPPPSSVSVQTRIDRNLDGGCRRVHKGSADFAQIRESSRP
ncbi:crooked neck protein- putative / cell cycle protein- putative [Striga hermonthica]|uniref:Crooked neck protein- putative / cell cycle protein- putative n=1 Tax=Striga hermonthica TaxID=68872 RepID=A0A9N7NSH1_STRHE|nr:crooked neck protein- putative / cell cycle protein- putative [Striga hermonthica]